MNKSDRLDRISQLLLDIAIAKRAVNLYERIMAFSKCIYMHKSFWYFIQTSLSDACVIRSAKIIDTRGGTWNLGQFLIDIKSNKLNKYKIEDKPINLKTIDTDIKRTKEKSIELKNLIIYRHNYTAHLSESLFKNENIIKLDTEDISNVINMCEEIYLKYAVYFINADTINSVLSRSDELKEFDEIFSELYNNDTTA